jgi:hypothetical protein
LQKAEIIDYQSKTPDLKLLSIAKWSEDKFSLSSTLSKSCISKTLKSRDSIPPVNEIFGNQEDRRKLTPARLPKLEAYLYQVILDHQSNKVGISGPAIKWLAKCYCLTELKHTEETMPSLSSGWFEGFKN